MPLAVIGYPALNKSLKQLYARISSDYIYDTMSWLRGSEIEHWTLTLTKDLNEIESAIGEIHTYIMNEALSEKRIYDEQEEDNEDDNGYCSDEDDNGPYRRVQEEFKWFKEILKAPDEVQEFLKMVVVLPLIDMGYRFSGKTCICPFNKNSIHYGRIVV